ncbi:UPF0175 family protein [Desulfoscipio geothermicus]|uniref:Predicted antitoxin, contains HTH domain n=1 Tax=Desulfoscipio geothermicus DSM 3669 TaxID=1121426 RepID=A0A1I6E8U0_9FIRM|nr:UPF0175 family protein [Desulfoscipio geothermicus]SFR14126.1 Predicted antitoxin, contains HTH domain [Desulfoscipio geothermicus DSM 3669]
MENVKIEFNIPKDVLVAASISEKNAPHEIKKLLAVYLFKERILSFGKACELSGLAKTEFLVLIGCMKIPLNYDIEDFEEDLTIVRDTTV